MNRKLSDQRIRTTCRALLIRDGSVSGRGLRAELRRRFAAAGKTERIFAIWREETGAQRAAALPREVRELQQRLLDAEAAAGEHLARAERAEYREQAHQDHWAVEIDRLRQAGVNASGTAVIIRELQEQVFKLSRELAAARAALSERAGR
jgi:hypothetical protein